MFCGSGIDWAATGAMLSGIGALVTGFAAFFAIVIAYPDWKRRENYKAKALDARSILATFYEGRQVLDSIRSPATYGYEIDEAQKIIEDAPNLRILPDAVRRRHQQRIVTQLRANRHADYWERVFKLLPVAKAVFDDDVEQGLLSIIRARQSVLAAADVYPVAEDDRAQWERIFWKGIANPDQIDGPLDDSATILREKLAEYLHTRRSFFGDSRQT